MKITEDVSQWQTVPKIIEWIESKSISLHPFVVDIGASDGKLNSNSWTFIRDNDWRGILVEPNPQAANRAVCNYSDLLGSVVIVPCAISDYEGEAYLNVPSDPEHEQLGSLVQKFDTSVKINTILPNTLVQNYDIKDVGVLSVDTEGHDLAVLTSWMKTTSVRPQVIITESWPHLGYANLSKTALMAKAHYKKILHCGENEVFVFRSLNDPI
jgi:FkbM family methyltransferase